MYLENIIKDFLGRRDYYSEEQIIKYTELSKNFDPLLEKLDNATALLFFQTSKQQTWLVSTNKNIYCILDDNREDKPHINWSISKKELFNSEINIRDYSEELGQFDIGSEKNWLYSKKLFKNSDIKNSIIREIYSFNLKTTSFLRKEKQEEFQEKHGKGRIYYDIRVMVDSDVEGALEKINEVEYHLHPTYPEPIKKNKDYENKFLMKELAFDEYQLLAKVFLKNREKPIELRQRIKLHETGPFFIRGYIIEPKAELKGANLRKANLKNVDLTGADLRKANLEEADLSKSKLMEAKLHEGKLMGANLEEAKLGMANLTEACLVNAKLNRADLMGANLEKASLDGAELRSSHLEEAVLKGTKLIKTTLTGAKLNGATLEEAILKEANLMDAELKKAVLKGADLSKAQLSRAELIEAKLMGAKLEDARLIRTNLLKAVLTDANLTKADLTDANLEQTKLLRANLFKADLTVTKLMKADLTDANLEEANLTGANLDKAKLVRAIIDKKCLKTILDSHFWINAEFDSDIKKKLEDMSN